MKLLSLMAAVLTFMASAAQAADCPQCAFFKGSNTGIKPPINQMVDICFDQSQPSDVALFIYRSGAWDGTQVQGGVLYDHANKRSFGTHGCFHVGLGRLEPGHTSLVVLCNGTHTAVVGDGAYALFFERLRATGMTLANLK